MKRGGNLKRSPMARGTVKLARGPVKASNPKRKAATFTRVYGDADRAAAIRLMPCLVDDASCAGWIENAHVPSKSGAGRKGDARHVVPLCSAHHRTGPDSLHQLNKDGFRARHGINLDDAAAEIEALYPSHPTPRASHE